jgi:hypothetical protein
MIRRLLSLLFLGALVVPAGAPAQANGPGSVYSDDHYDEPYSNVDPHCGFPWKIAGHASGHRVVYNVVGSHHQAFLEHDHYRWHETWTNLDNGKKAYAHGHGYFRELSGEHVKGDLWRFLTIDEGVPFAVANAKHQQVLSDSGRITLRALIDTLGDHQPGGEIKNLYVIDKKGHFPTYAKDFDFCHLARRLLK